MISRLVTKAAVLGVAASFALAVPASAAAKPTLAGPEEVKGYAQFTMTGTADPGSTVTLWETAIGINDMKPADNWEGGGGPVTAVADSAGKFSIKRWLDSGFWFEVHQGDVVSNRITVYSKVAVSSWVTSPSTGTAVVQGEAIPAQPGLPVRIEKQSASGTWTTVANTTTAGSEAAFSHTFTGLATGEHTYRAYVGPDASNGVRADYSEAHSTWVQGSTSTPPTTPPTSGPAVGAIQFTKIQYDSPGTDSGSNGSLNTEWVKLTNKTKAAINLNGWTVRDAQNIIYKFPSLSLPASGSVFIQTGKGTNTATHRFWGRAGKTGYVWNNTGDTAYLRTAANKTIDSCKWTSQGAGNTNC
ncbi:lamin tail domain-containing protein [Actinoplanes sp. URMC 104]|uniref:lamin tail domain-containing protein n=1 Tax=Actinoplanes sp. URMC 104 TaxID=3423409 RepID=UPI003F1B95B1